MTSDHSIIEAGQAARTSFGESAENPFAASFYDAMLEVSSQPNADVLIFAEWHRLENTVFYNDPDLYAALRETGRDKFGIELPIELNDALQNFQDQKITKNEFMEQYIAYAETVMGTMEGHSYKMIENVLDQVEAANAEGVRVYFYDSLAHLDTEIEAVAQHFTEHVEAENPAYIAAQGYLDGTTLTGKPFFEEAIEFDDASSSFVGDIVSYLREAALNDEITIEQFLEVKRGLNNAQMENRLSVDTQNAQNIRELMGESGIALNAGYLHVRAPNAVLQRPEGLPELDDLLGGEERVYTVELFGRPGDYRISEPLSGDRAHAIFIADRIGGTGTYIPTDKSTSLIVQSPEVSARIDGLGNDELPPFEIKFK